MTNELANCPHRKVLWLLFWNFFKIALWVVGGGLAIILVADEIFVKKLRWLKDGELLDMLTVIQSVPGLTAGNAALYVGYRSAGHLGGFLALLGVALPSYLIITLLSMGFEYLPMDNLYLQSAFIGVRTAMSGLMLATIIRLWKKIIQGILPWLIMIVCFIAMAFLKINPGWLIAGSIAIGIVCTVFPTHPTKQSQTPKGLATLLVLFLLFMYFGLVCFGGGAILVNFYLHELVELRNWITSDELANMIAISQVTPGPISVNAATLIGYRQAGVLGAAVSTIGLLFPSYILMTTALKSLDKWEHSRIVGNIMASIRPATVGLMIAVTLVYLQMSVFTTNIPWQNLLNWFTGHPANFSGFGVRIPMIPVLIASAWLLYKSKTSIMVTIFSAATIGIICSHWM